MPTSCRTTSGRCLCSCRRGSGTCRVCLVVVTGIDRRRSNQQAVSTCISEIAGHALGSVSGGKEERCGVAVHSDPAPKHSRRPFPWADLVDRAAQAWRLRASTAWEPDEQELLRPLLQHLQSRGVASSAGRIEVIARRIVPTGHGDSETPSWSNLSLPGPANRS